MKMDIYSDRAKSGRPVRPSGWLSPAGTSNLGPSTSSRSCSRRRDGLACRPDPGAGGQLTSADATETDAAPGQAAPGRGRLRPALHEARHRPGMLRRRRGRSAKGARDAFVLAERLLSAIAKEGGESGRVRSRSARRHRFQSRHRPPPEAVRKGRPADWPRPKRAMTPWNATSATYPGRPRRQASKPGEHRLRDEEIRRTIQVLSRRTAGTIPS